MLDVNCLYRYDTNKYFFKEENGIIKVSLNGKHKYTELKFF